MKPSACDTQRLHSLLAAPRDVGDDTLTEHLTHCVHCQREIEQLAAGDWWWNQSRAWLAASDGVAPPLTDESWSHVGLEGRGPRSDTSLDFLEAANQPDLLGQLGKYQIESVIGQGGMGVVLKGFDHELNRTVAIKVLAPHLASSGTARQRFAREARAAAAVVHDHVVAIHGIETNRNLPYLVMPFVAGESLQKHVENNGPLDPTDVTRIAMQIAAGLGAAHEQGLVHRDIKPANILLENGFGRVLITDFGLARAADDASITRSGLVAGTPHYMSPEQAQGGSVDARSDLFSLGSVMFFMATGRAPFRGEGTMAVLHAICHKEATPVRQLEASLPRPLELIIERLLRKRPEERYPSAARVRCLLADYLAHRQDPTRNRLPGELAPGSRTPLAATLSCLLALLILLAVWIGVPGAGPPVRPAGMVRPVGGGDVLVEQPHPTAGMGNSPSPAATPFDHRLRSLHEAIDQLEQQWRQEETPPRRRDDWELRQQSLAAEMRKLERAWSGRPTD